MQPITAGTMKAPHKIMQTARGLTTLNFGTSVDLKVQSALQEEGPLVVNVIKLTFSCRFNHCDKRFTGI